MCIGKSKGKHSRSIKQINHLTTKQETNNEVIIAKEGSKKEKKEE